MNWEDVKIGQFVLYKDNWQTWLGEITDKNSKAFGIKDLYCDNSSFVSQEEQRYPLSKTHLKILKVYNEFPKEFLI